MLTQGIGVRMHLKYEWKIKNNFVSKRVPTVNALMEK